MSFGFLVKISLVLLLLSAALLASGVELPENVPEKHSFSEAEWKKITKDIDYSKEAPPAERRLYKGFDFNLNPQIGKAIIFIIVFALLVFILMKVMKGNMLLGDKKINIENAFTDERPGEDIHKDDLEKLYAESLAAGNFRLAVRYCYLMIIRELSTKQLIMWRKEKTNSDYIFDMMNNAFAIPFREVTFLFERIWYGETELTEKNFLLVNSRFNQFISEVKGNLSADTGAPIVPAES